MAWYAYKNVLNRIPSEYEDQVRRDTGSYECDANYDGDGWIAASNWIDDLLDQNASLKALLLGSGSLEDNLEILDIALAIVEFFAGVRIVDAFQRGRREELESLHRIGVL